MSTTPLRIQVLFESPGKASVKGVDDAIGLVDRSIQAAASRTEAAISSTGQRIEATVIRIARVATVQLGNAFSQINGQLGSMLTAMREMDRMSNQLGRLGVNSATAARVGGAAGLNLQSFLNEHIAKGFSPTGRGTLSASSMGVRSSQEYANDIGRKLNAIYNTKDELTSVKVGLPPNSNPERDLAQLLQNSNLKALGKIAGERSNFEEKYRASIEKEVGAGIRRRAMDYAAMLDGLDDAMQQSQKDLAAELKAAAGQGKRDFSSNARIREVVEKEVGEGIRIRAEEWAQYFANLDQAKITSQREMMTELHEAGLKGKQDFASSQRVRDAVEREVGQGIRARADEWAQYFAGVDEAKVNAQRDMMSELNVASAKGKREFSLQQQQREQLEKQVAALNHGDASQFLASGKYLVNGARLGSGGQILTEYKNALGSSAILNQDTGQLESKISLLDRLTTGWKKFAGSIQSGERGSVGSLSRIGDSMIRISATIYSMERLAGLFKRVLIDPVSDLTGAIIKADEASRKFEYGISGVAGGLSRARQLNRSIIELSQNSPLSVEELRESTQTLARTPALSVRLGLGDPGSTAAEAERFASVVGRLGALDPSQGSSGAQIAILNSLQGGQGGLVSLRRRFGISPQTLSSLSGSSIADLKSDPAKTLEAIEKVADTFIPEDSFRMTANLVSVRWKKVQDAVQWALAQAGDRGVFDSIGNRLKAISDQMFEYFGSADFDREASKVSERLNRVLNNVARSAEQLLATVTGTPADVSSVAGAVKTTGNILDRIGRLSDNLPAAVDKLGPAISEFTARLGGFFDAVIDVADAIRDPVGYAKRVAGGAAASRTGQDINASTLDVLKRAGIDTTSIGTRFYSPGTNSDHIYGDLRQQGVNFPSAFGQFAIETVRDAIGSNVSSIEELDFRKLPLEQRILAQKLYSQLQQTGQINPDLVRQLGGLGITHQVATGTLNPRADEDSTTSIVRKLISREFQSPNFSALLTAANAGSSGLSEFAERDQSSLERLKDLGDVFGKVKIGKDDVVSFAELLKRVDEQFGEAKTILERAVGEADRQLQLGGNDPQLRANSNELRKQRDRLIDNYRNALEAITQNKIDAVRDYGTALGQAISDFPPQARVEIQRAIVEGTTSQAKRFEEVFGGLPAGGARNSFGIGGATLEQAQRMYQSSLQSRIDAVGSAGKIGDILSLSPTANFDQLAALRPLSTNQANRQLLSYLKGEGTAEAKDLLSRAAKEFNANPDDTSLANLRAAQVSVAELQTRVRELTRDLDPLAKGFQEMATSARDALERGLGDSIYSLISGVGTLEDALRGFAQSIVRTFSDIQARNLVQGLLGDFGQSQQGGGIGSLGGIASAIANVFMNRGAGSSVGTVSAPTAYNTGFGSGGIFGAANGGIFEGGIVPIHGYANGGIVEGGISRMPLNEFDRRGMGSMPVRMFANGGMVTAGSNTLAMIGEGSLNEAVIPLPDGRHVEAVVKGGGSPNVNVYIVRDEDEAFRQGFIRNKDILVNEMQHQASKGKLAKLRR